MSTPWTRRGSAATQQGTHPTPKRTRQRRFAVMTLAFAVATLGFAGPLAATASAASTLDQSQPVNGLCGQTVGSALRGQTFTAGLSGPLTEVDLHLRKYDFLGETLNVQIWDTVAGAPSASLVSVSVPASAVSSAGGWVAVDFPSPVTVQADTQYAIVLSATFARFGWDGACGSSSYTEGETYASFNDVGDPWYAQGMDLTFKTYVETTPIVLSPSTLPNATVGAPYSQTLSATGGTAPYSFALTSGALPAGMSLSSAGFLSGTPTAGGTFNFTVAATDADSDTGSQAYSLIVGAPSISVGPNGLTGGTVGEPYSLTFTASGGIAPYTFAVTSGAIPAGLSLDAASGTLSGTPTTAQEHTFTITATDSSTGTATHSGSRSYPLTIAPPADRCGGATGLPITDQLATGSATTAARGTAGSWSFTVSMQNCTGDTVSSARLQGVTAGWLSNASAVTNIQAGSISIAPYVKNKGQVVRWTPFTLAHGDAATITVTVTGTVTTGAKCGSRLPLSGPWTGTGLTPAGTSLSSTVSTVPKVTVTC